MKRLACIIFLSLGFILSVARPNNVTFTHLGLNDGLSDTQVTKIMQDSKGFMWFSTRNGLNRYDGHDVKTFMRQPSNPNSLPDNMVNEIYEDADGLFWIHTAWHQYICYDPKLELFRPADKVLAELYGIAVTPNHIVVDDNKCLWVADTRSIYYFDSASNRACEMPTSSKRLDDGVSITAISPAHSGLIVIYSDGSFDRIDKAKDCNVESNYDLTRLLSDTSMLSSVYCDNEGDLWFYGYDLGIMLYDDSESQWFKLDNTARSKYKLSSLSVSDIIQDSKGDIWIATDHGGINVINKNSGAVTYINHIPHNSSSLLQNSVTCLYCDNTGGIWVGYHKHGISYHNDEKQNFMFDDLSELETDPDFTADINAFATDHDGVLWIGTSNGLVSKNLQTGSVNRYSFSKGDSSVYGNVVTSLLSASDGKLYIGTYQNGLKVYDGKSFTDYHHNANTASLADNNVWSLEEDEDGLIWIGTLGNGFQWFNPSVGGLSPIIGQCTILYGPSSDIDTLKSIDCVR